MSLITYDKLQRKIVGILTTWCFNTEDPSKYKRIFMKKQDESFFFNILGKYLVLIYLIIAYEFKKLFKQLSKVTAAPVYIHLWN